MLVHIPGVLDEATLAHFRQALADVDWQDGRGSAGYLSRAVKQNQQLPDQHPVGRELGRFILASLDRNPLFTSAALPARILPPLFNRYAGGQTYGRHVDGAIRPLTDSGLRVRTDLSATLFLMPPEDYDGGELVIEDTYGAREVKLAAGDMVLYPGTSVHHVNPVTRGERVASFFWVQSMVREDSQRRILFDLDQSIQRLATDHPGDDTLVDLAGIYHNLLRAWAEI